MISGSKVAGRNQKVLVGMEKLAVQAELGVPEVQAESMNLEAPVEMTKQEVLLQTKRQEALAEMKI